MVVLIAIPKFKTSKVIESRSSVLTRININVINGK